MSRRPRKTIALALSQRAQSLPPIPARLVPGTWLDCANSPRQSPVKQQFFAASSWPALHFRPGLTAAFFVTQESLPHTSVPEVMSASPMNHEQEADHEQRHEEIILSDHDALLLLTSISEPQLT